MITSLSLTGSVINISSVPLRRSSATSAIVTTGTTRALSPGPTYTNRSVRLALSTFQKLAPERAWDVGQNASAVALTVDAAGAMRESAKAVDDIREHARIGPTVLAGDGHESACIALFHVLLHRYAGGRPPHKQKPPGLGGLISIVVQRMRLAPTSGGSSSGR